MHPERTCITCGCLQNRPCMGGCYWVPNDAGVDVCSRCMFVDGYRQMGTLLLLNLRVLGELHNAKGIAERTRARVTREKKRRRSSR